MLPPTEPLSPARPSALRKILIGKDGLRAGWSLLIFIVIFAAIAFCVRIIGHKVHPPVPKAANTPSEPASPSFLFVAESIPFLITVLVTWIMSKIERRPISVYGLGDSRKLAHFLAGLAWGSYLSIAPHLDARETWTPRHRRPSAFWQRHCSLRSDLAGRIFPGRHARGVSDSRLPSIHTHPRSGRRL